MASCHSPVGSRILGFRVEGLVVFKRREAISSRALQLYQVGLVHSALQLALGLGFRV